MTPAEPGLWCQGSSEAAIPLGSLGERTASNTRLKTESNYHVIIVGSCRRFKSGPWHPRLSPVVLPRKEIYVCL